LVYVPSCEDRKDEFLAELNLLRSIRSEPWLLCGDFNWIYRAKDKNNDRLDRRRMGQFRHFLNESLLKEIHLQGHLFTWSNERSHTTLERIDLVSFQVNGNSCSPIISYNPWLPSDHAPLLIQTSASFISKKQLHFKSFWTKCDKFLEVVQRAWNCPLRDANPFKCLGRLLRNTVKSLNS
jgi:hypothetical protein